MSKNATFRQYIDQMKFKLPEEFPNAKYVVIFALENKLAKANFQYQGKQHEIMISPGYYRTGITNDDLLNLIRNEIIKNDSYRIERARAIHLKLLAVRSGLARYGKNNISYVDGFGSFLALYAYYTDFDFKQSKLYEKKFLDQCTNCKICLNKCPTKAITEENLVIDVGNCVTLYNEIEKDFPEWLDPSAHNALFGCMRCQMYCPANKDGMNDILRFQDVTEEETTMLLEGRKDEELVKSLSEKLNIFTIETYDDYLPIIKRNLEVLLNQ
ncbi:MAG: 4Fe-4S double cluster binding domain-containing protein [Candidatus Thorarchaeota archaeon]